jgi:hypothetical protein
MGAPLIKQRSSYHLGEGKSKGEKSIPRSSAPPHISKLVPLPPHFPHFHHTPPLKKKEKSLKLSPICPARTHWKERKRELWSGSLNFGIVKVLFKGSNFFSFRITRFLFRNFKKSVKVFRNYKIKWWFFPS